MAEKINFNDVHQDQIGWAILTAIEGLRLGDPFFKEMKSGEPLEVELKINGKEFNFSQIIKRISEESNRWADKRAAQIVDQKAKGILEPTEELTREVASFVREKIRELFPNVDLDNR